MVPLQFLLKKETAKSEFNKAIAKSEEFKSKGMESNPFIAGEAVNKLADILHEEFVSIELKQPQSNINQKQERLRGLLTELNTAYSKVLTFGSPRSFQATYNIARSYEEFADIYSDQEIDPSLDVNKRFVKRKQINEQSAALYDNAVEQFKEVVDKIPVIADKLGVDMFGEEPVDTMQVQPVDTLASTESVREAEPDSTRDLALRFYNKAKDKISELLYVQASITSENVENALLVQPPTNDPLGALLYTSSVYEKVVAPAVDLTIQAHIKNIEKGQELGLSNKYIEESKRQILLTSNILAQEYENLSRKALNQYEDFYSEFQDSND